LSVGFCDHRLAHHLKRLTNHSLMVQAPGLIRGVNPKSKIQNPKSVDKRHAEATAKSIARIAKKAQDLPFNLSQNFISL
jgi:hypothetical protein